jgi:hypothetical protein
MNYKLCVRLGIAAGGAVGALVGLLHGVNCCSPPHPPSVSQLVLAGIMVALLGVFFAAAIACLVNHIAVSSVFTLALLIAIFSGLLLGPLAYHLTPPWLAFLVCAFLGALLGWLVCRIVCTRFQRYTFEVSR